jgi:catechol 2,3-dioxygenase-like lactoylglutathione lyase family enzyme
MNLNHVHLGTKNLDNSVGFYQNLFGFRKKFDHPPGIFLENEFGFLLAIDPVEELPNFPSWYHLGFCVSSEQAALAMYQKCKSANVKIVRELMHQENEFVSFFILDPDGYKLEVSWHNE